MNEDLLLLPRPRKLSLAKGRCEVAGGVNLAMADESRSELGQVARTLRSALSEFAGDVDAASSETSRPDGIELAVRLEPQRIPHDEGYALEIYPGRIELIARDPAGAFRGAMTLKQIARQSTGGLPCLRIEDWPDFAHRGVMLDISRDKVPTMQTLFALVDLMAEWKINQLQLYTEHTFAYARHPTVWQDASPMTAQEVRALDRYCRERFIELVPNQNSFGHMERWLKHDAYRRLAETPEDPRSLCPIDPAAIELIGGLYAELLPNFSSGLFNVGCDETWELGKGRSRRACEQRGVGRVYLDFLLKIHELARSHGRRMMFWGDIIMQHPELIRELPPDVIALEWGYEADHPFDTDGRKFAEAGVPFHVCPGASSWCSIAGRGDNARANLLNAARSGIEYGAEGFLITDWGDHGHWQYLPVSYAGFAFGAAVSWCLESNRDLDVPRALDLHAFHDAAGVMGRLAWELGNAYRLTGHELPNRSLIWQQFHAPGDPEENEKRARFTPRRAEQTLAAIDQAIGNLPQAKLDRPDADLISDEFRNAAAMMRHACRMAGSREGGEAAGLTGSAREKLIEDLRSIIDEHRRLWLARNRPGGLADSVARFEKVLKTLYRA